jgi:hypothetical protein
MLHHPAFCESTTGSGAIEPAAANSFQFQASSDVSMVIGIHSP